MGSLAEHLPQAQAERWALNSAVYLATAEQLSQGLTLFDPEGGLVLANRRFRALWRLPERLCREGTHQSVLLPASPGAQLLLDEIAPAVALGQPPQRRREWLLHDARILAVSTVTLPTGLLLALHDDVTEQRHQERQAALRARQPTATGLPERPGLLPALDGALARNQPGHEIALLRIHLMATGTDGAPLQPLAQAALWREVAERLRGATRENDCCLHLGGADFAVLQTGTAQPAGAMALGQRLASALMAPSTGPALAELAVAIGASVGVSLAPFDADDSTTLLACAEAAVASAQAAGAGSVHFFDPGQDTRPQAHEGGSSATTSGRR